MKLKHINEELTKLKDYNIYYTFNWNNILKYIKEKEKPWAYDNLHISNIIRLVYDKNLDLFIIGDGEDFIHMNLFDGLIHTTSIYDKLNILNNWETYFHKNVVSVVISDDLYMIKREYEYLYVPINDNKIYIGSDRPLQLLSLREIKDGIN